ncbi:unnamed protein product [Didymodactylos carnosus]|uniref:RRM domain-containing protein n=1 Tax=Didymodactylos carnosus TaxID=1234261 RepID=A0A8S2MRW3_9BILA|nr:unnamed protein product [Didymodactylos carnosus]CAF3970128.1 unnamed protein product [Didymodactylos carnosus]
MIGSWYVYKVLAPNCSSPSSSPPTSSQQHDQNHHHSIHHQQQQQQHYNQSTVSTIIYAQQQQQQQQQLELLDEVDIDEEYLQFSEETAAMANYNRQQHGSGSLTDDDISDSKARTNLIINYLPQTMTQDEIKDLFGSIGAIESCKLVRDKITGQSLGYGFVNFIRTDDAEKAVKQMNGLRLQNKTIKVSFARPSSDSIKGANLYVSGISKGMSQEEFESTSKGVGFIRFDQRCEAEIAISKLNGTIPKGFTDPINVKFANTPNAAKSMMGLPLAPYISGVPGAPAQQAVLTTVPPIRQQLNRYRYSPLSPADFFAATASYLPAAAAAAASATTLPPSTGWCIFVYNLAPETEEAVLWQLFGPFGAVQNVKVIRDFQTQKCKGFGFVTMTNYDEALMAINSLNGFTLGNRVLQVSFKTNKPQPFKAF